VLQQNGDLKTYLECRGQHRFLSTLITLQAGDLISPERRRASPVQRGDKLEGTWTALVI